VGEAWAGAGGRLGVQAAGVPCCSACTAGRSQLMPCTPQPTNPPVSCCPPLCTPQVCGTDGQWYQHPCFATCNKAEIKYNCGDRKDCPTACWEEFQLAKGKTCDCPDIDLPVCSFSGVVFPNSCQATVGGCVDEYVVGRVGMMGGGRVCGGAGGHDGWWASGGGDQALY